MFTDPAASEVSSSADLTRQVTDYTQLTEAQKADERLFTAPAASEISSSADLTRQVTDYTRLTFRTRTSLAYGSSKWLSEDLPLKLC